MRPEDSGSSLAAESVLDRVPLEVIDAVKNIVKTMDEEKVNRFFSEIRREAVLRGFTAADFVALTALMQVSVAAMIHAYEGLPADTLLARMQFYSRIISFMAETIARFKADKLEKFIEDSRRKDTEAEDDG